jgi:hypothetical protein
MKAWGHIRDSAGTLFLDDGFNMTFPSIDGVDPTILHVFFTDDMANNSYAPVVTVIANGGAPSVGITPMVFNMAHGGFDLRLYDPAAGPGFLDFTSGATNYAIALQVAGRQ